MKTRWIMRGFLGTVLLSTGCALIQSKPVEVTKELGKEIVKHEVPYLSFIDEQLSSGYSLVPRESVELSKKIGEGLGAQQAAYANLFNRYFAEKRRQIDTWIKETYVPNLAKEKLRRYGKLKDNETLLKEVIAKSVQKRNAMQRELEKARLAIWENVLDSYTALRHANAELNALLQTFTEADKVQERLVMDAAAIVPPEFSFSEFDELFENYLLEAGGGGRKTRPLLEDYELEIPQEEE